MLTNVKIYVHVYYENTGHAIFPRWYSVDLNRLTLAIRYAERHKLPAVIITLSCLDFHGLDDLARHIIRL